MSVKFQFMAVDLELVLFCHTPLERLDLLVLEFDDPAATDTDQMVMVSLGSVEFKAGDPVLESAFMGQSGLSKQLQRPVDRGIADPLVGRS